MLGLTSAFNYMPVLVLHYANKLFDYLKAVYRIGRLN